MEIRHNTSLLEKALEHIVRHASIPSIEAEAKAQERVARAQGFKRMATGAALGIAAIGIGIGIWLAYPRLQLVDQYADHKTDKTTNQVQTADAPAPIEPKPTPKATDQPVSSKTSSPDDVNNTPDVITTNYTIFNNKTVILAGRTWDVTAGHFFANETDKEWTYSYCYTEDVREGINVKIDLASRQNPTLKPVAPTATSQTLQKVNLSSVEALTLATKCPWLDKRTYTVKDFTGSPGQNNPFEPAETTYKLAGSKLIVEGSIGDDFLKRLQSFSFNELQIDSPGGLIDVAIDTGKWLRENQKTVHVASHCLSACVFALAGGEKRTADPTAHIGVHRFYNLGPDSTNDTEIAQEISSEILLYLEAMGIDAELFHIMAKTPSTDMFYVDRAKLIAWNLLSPIEVSSPEIVSSEELAAIRDRFLMNSSSVWIHQDTVVGLSKNGSRRTLRILQTGNALSKTGASRGSHIFEGTVNEADDYTGVAYIFHPCGTRSFEVEGSLYENQKVIELEGRAEAVDDKCSQTGMQDTQLRFEMVGLSSSSTLFADLSKRGITLPPGLKDDNAAGLPVDIKGFSLIAGSDFPGGDYSTLKNIDLTQCANDCAKQAQCNGFTYNKIARWCFLKSTINASVSMRDAVAGRKLQ